MKRNLSLLVGKKTADLACIATLVLLTLVVFRDYLSGQRSPSWDFLGDYLTNAISWWNLGSFFSPAIYIPYAFSGYPAYLSAQSPAVWSNDRVAAEQFYYGETSSEINKRVKDYEPSFREERSGPTFPIPYPAELTFQTWNKSEIDKSFTLGGLVSLKGVTRYEDLLETAMSKDGVEYFELLRQPLSAWVVDKEQANLETAKCIIDNSCTNLNVNSKVTNWKPSRYSIELSDAASGLLVTNEVAWAGWHAKVCSTSSCSVIPVASDLGNKLVAVQITDNANSVEFFYKQPYKTESWVGFSIGVSLLLFLVVINNKSRKNLVYK